MMKKSHYKLTYKNMGNFNRDNRGQGRDRDFRRERPQMHQTTCSDCGKNCEVPFRPTNEKPVYCNDCFQNHGGRTKRFEKSDQRGGRFQDKRQDSYRERSTDNQCKEAIDRLTNKMDVIIDLLTVKQEVKKTVKETKKTKTKPVLKNKK
jgi:CxxC-x17-CxxC domain-containing protein